jgi:hypothetical protein
VRERTACQQSDAIRSRFGNEQGFGPPNPESGIHLPGLLRAGGAVDIHVELHPLVITSLAAYRTMRNPDAVLTYLVQRRQVGADRAAAFIADLEARDREGSFLATSIIYVVSGRKATD